MLSPSGTYYIDPYYQHDGSVYMSYAKSDLSFGSRQFKCLVDGKDLESADRSRDGCGEPGERGPDVAHLPVWLVQLHFVTASSMAVMFPWSPMFSRRW